MYSWRQFSARPRLGFFTARSGSGLFLVPPASTLHVTSGNSPLQNIFSSPQQTKKGQKNFKAGVEDIVSEQSAVTVQPHPVRWSYSQLEFWRGPLSFFGFSVVQNRALIQEFYQKMEVFRTGGLPEVMYSMNAWETSQNPWFETGQINNLAWAGYWIVPSCAYSWQRNDSLYDFDVFRSPTKFEIYPSIATLRKRMNRLLTAAQPHRKRTWWWQTRSRRNTTPTHSAPKSWRKPEEKVFFTPTHLSPEPFSSPSFIYWNVFHFKIHFNYTLHSIKLWYSDSEGKNGKEKFILKINFNRFI